MQMDRRVRTLFVRACLLGLGVLALARPSSAQSPADIQKAIDAAYGKFRTLQEGKNADYIPALAKVDPNLFGIAVVTADGKVYTAGDVKSAVSIQSISKVFTMAQVIQEQGVEAIENRIGVDATGARFNSIIAVEGVRTVVGTGAPEMNPLVNPGAISATSMVTGPTSDAVWRKIIGFHNDAAGRDLSVLQDVYKSESDTNQRNQAIGALMLAYGYIKDNWQQAVDLYTRQCSIGVNVQDLATMAATLASGGRNPVTGKQVIDAARVPSVLAVMSTAGLYDDSGKWLYHTGLPAKSGVGGGIIAVSPGKFGIAVVSPPLDDAGNSVRAQRAIADISAALGGNPYGPSASTAAAAAQAQAPPKPSFEVYGFAMLDIGQNFTQIHPDWFDTLRLTKLPKFENEFGEDNSTFMGVRQSRMGFRSSTPTDLGELKTIFEFELFGTGVDSGQTTFRLRHAWGELGKLGAGQYWSPFSDPDVYPNTLEYWGPTGIPWFRNVQLRYTAVSTDTSNLMLALARPGASGDQGVYADRIELEGIRARFPLPDFAAAYKYNGDWGYVRTAGILRRIKWDDTLDDALDLSGDATGWGWNVSSNLKAGSSDVLRMQFTVGEGVQNEMNDSPVDIGIENNPSNPVTPIVGKPIPIVAVSVFLDHTWNKKYSSAVGYSWQDNDNTDAQAADAFRTGHYALGNLLYYPAPNVMFGGEFQWGRRENFSDGFSSDGVKVQFSFKYNFSWKLGG
jgi:glutaminase A